MSTGGFWAVQQNSMLSGKILEAIYKLHLHCDITFHKRWFWRKYLRKGDVSTLEIGPGGGQWTLELLELGNRVTVVDVDRESLKRLESKFKKFGCWDSSRVKLILSDIRNFRLEGHFDQIVLFEVLEHIKDDGLVMRKLAECLKPGGRMLVSTPSADYIPFYGEEVDMDDKGGHVRKGYSFKDFERVGREVGLEVIFRDSCCGYFTQRAIVVERVFSNYLTNIIFRMLLNALLRPLTKLDALYPSYPAYVNFVIFQRKVEGTQERSK